MAICPGLIRTVVMGLLVAWESTRFRCLATNTKAGSAATMRATSRIFLA